MAVARGLKRLRDMAADAVTAGRTLDGATLAALLVALKLGVRRDVAERGELATTAVDSDGDLILELPPCNDEQAWRDRYGSMWLYYWISFGCWLP